MRQKYKCSKVKNCSKLIIYSYRKLTLKEYYKLFVLGMLMKYPRDLTPPCNAKKKIITLSHRALQEEGGGGKREAN